MKNIEIYNKEATNEFLNLINKIFLSEKGKTFPLFEKELKELLEQNANVDVKDNDGNTAVIKSVMLNNLNLFNFLIKNNANLNIKNKEEQSVLHIATINQDIDIIKRIILFINNIDIGNGQGETPLMHATKLENIEIIKLLVTFGANIDKKDKNDWSARKIAEINDSFEILTFFNDFKNMDLLNKKIKLLKKEIIDLKEEKQEFKNIKKDLDEEINNYKNVLTEHSK